MDSMYIFLQHYWYFLVSLLGAIFVFLLFVQGGQTLLYTLGKDEVERTMLVTAIGRRWGLTFTTLVTFGGAFFASFPLFYSTSFSGAYWVWVAILLCFVLQAVAYEYRSLPRNFLGKRTFEVFLYINGFLGPILVGTAVGTFFTGSNFSVGRMNLTNPMQPVISNWNNAWHGLEAVADPRNVMLGLAVCFLARCLGLLYFLNCVDHEPVNQRARKNLPLNAIPFVIFFLGFVASILMGKGFAVDPENGTVFIQEYKYFLNLIEMPIVLVFFLLGVLSVLFGLYKGIFTKSRKGIWFAGFGTVATVVCLLLLAGFNNTAYYPANPDLQSSLTIFNSSSSEFTLGVMAIVSLLIPFVVAYIWYCWYCLDRRKLQAHEFDSKSGEPTAASY